MDALDLGKVSWNGRYYNFQQNLPTRKFNWTNKSFTFTCKTFKQQECLKWTILIEPNFSELLTFRVFLLFIKIVVLRRYWGRTPLRPPPLLWHLSPIFYSFPPSIVRINILFIKCIHYTHDIYTYIIAYKTLFYGILWIFINGILFG